MSPPPKPRGRAADRTARGVVATAAEPSAAPKTRTAPHEVRIIGGQWKRSKLPVPHAPGLRPTPDRVRETLFNWLGRNLDGWRCLDAFAGSGALGFEAASRGASAVTLLDRDAHLVRGLHASRERLKAQTLHIATADAITWMARCAEASFELIFIDPPFDASLFEPAMQAATRVVVPGGWVYLEADREFGPDAFPGLTRHRHGRAGAVHFHLFQRHEPL